MITESGLKLFVSVATAVGISISGWNLLSTVDNAARISVVEERSSHQRDRIVRIEDKIDWLIAQRVSEMLRDPEQKGVPTRRPSYSYEEPNGRRPVIRKPQAPESP